MKPSAVLFEHVKNPKNGETTHGWPFALAFPMALEALVKAAASLDEPPREPRALEAFSAAFDIAVELLPTSGGPAGIGSPYDNAPYLAALGVLKRG